VRKLCLEYPAVQPLQRDFAVMDVDYLFHVRYLSK
jgi:hypothetical protein